MSLAFGDTHMDDKRLRVVDIFKLFSPHFLKHIQSTSNMKIVLEFLIKSPICRLIVPLTENLQQMYAILLSESLLEVYLNRLSKKQASFLNIV